MIEVSCIQCSKCGNIIFSRCVGDQRSCTCRSIGITRTNIHFQSLCFLTNEQPPPIFNIPIDLTTYDLYDDFLHNINKYGLFKDLREIFKLAENVFDIKTGKSNVVIGDYAYSQPFGKFIDQVLIDDGSLDLQFIFPYEIRKYSANFLILN